MPCFYTPRHGGILFSRPAVQWSPIFMPRAMAASQFCIPWCGGIPFSPPEAQQYSVFVPHGTAVAHFCTLRHGVLFSCPLTKGLVRVGVFMCTCGRTAQRLGTPDLDNANSYCQGCKECDSPMQIKQAPEIFVNRLWCHSYQCSSYSNWKQMSLLFTISHVSYELPKLSGHVTGHLKKVHWHRHIL